MELKNMSKDELELLRNAKQQQIELLREEIIEITAVLEPMEKQEQMLGKLRVMSDNDLIHLEEAIKQRKVQSMNTLGIQSEEKMGIPGQ